MSEQANPTFPVSAALKQYRLVRRTGSPLKLAYGAAASTDVIGSTNKETFAADENVSVNLITNSETRKLVAAGAISDNAEFYQAADGKIASSGTVKKGRVLEAATADGDVIECIVY